MVEGVTYVRVRSEADTRLDHIVKVGLFFDGSGKSLCGKSSWPSRWEDARGHQPRVTCVDCRDRFRKAGG